MERIDLLPTQLRRLSHPGIAFTAFLERRAPGSERNCRENAVDEPSRTSVLAPSGCGLTASIASTAAQRAAATALVESRYAWRGYALEPGGSAGQAGVTLIALQTGATMGTVTLQLDGPAGLAADEGYRATIDAVRQRGRRVCELTRLALDSAAEWRPTLGALLGLAYLVGRAVHEVTDVFVEVNPRHERFYRHMFGFAAAAGRQVCPRVKAPAVLLRLEVERLDARLADCGFLRRAPFGPPSMHALAA